MLARLLFGTIDFPENEELLEFQYKLLMVLMASGALFTFAFIAADGINLNAMDNPHLKMHVGVHRCGGHVDVFSARSQRTLCTHRLDL